MVSHFSRYLSLAPIASSELIRARSKESKIGSMVYRLIRNSLNILTNIEIDSQYTP